MPTFEMTGRMLLAESIGTGRVELENIFIYQYITFLFGSLELHRQLFTAQSSRDCWATAGTTSPMMKAVAGSLRAPGREVAVGRSSVPASKVMPMLLKL
ncbi:hypothetical protein [Rhizobium leguminosarum]|uniref:hypothetical protein n=1 Tax=Rhizobium leguminosarum TaxID=384 RepID=UPI003F9C834A